jgi:Holliday junction resolvase
LARHLGYSALTTPPSGDAGVDVVAHRGNNIVAIQCKLYGQTRVTSDAIQKLLASKVIHNATHFICITTGHFTKSANELASSTGVMVIDGSDLTELCKQNQFTFRSTTSINSQTSSWSMYEDIMQLGRSEESHIRLDNMSISRRHCLFERKGLYLTVTDLGSSFGSKLNGTQLVIGQRTLLTYGDQLTLANEEFTIEGF